MAEDPDDSSDDAPHDEEPVGSTGSESSPAEEGDTPDDNELSESSDASETGEADDGSDGAKDSSEEPADDTPEGSSEEPDSEADDDVPVLDGSDADTSDTDDSGGLTKLDDSGPSPGSSGPESDSGDETAPPSEGTINPPGAPPSGPTRSRPDDQAGDTGSSAADPGESPADEGADSDADEEAATDDSESAESDVATENDPDQSDEPGCEAAPPDDEDSLDHVRTDDAVVNPASEDDERTATHEPTAATAAQAGPPDDQEMPLTEHIREMVSRLAVVAIIAAGVAVLSYPLSETMITQMWYHVHPGSHSVCVDEPLNPAHGCAPPHVYGPLEFILTKLKFSGLVGLVTAIPFAVYQTYLFMRPGLYPSERRYYLASVPLSLVLALLGMAFAFLVILPLLFEYFLQYTAETVDVAFQLSDTVDLMLVLMGWSALIFQIPLMMTLAVMMGVTTRRWMQQKRIYFWAGFGGIAFFFVAADPTGMASVLLTITMIILFEVTLLLLRWTGR